MFFDFQVVGFGGRADVRVLAVDPDTAWKREDMARAYEELAQRFGPPRAVLVDGASE